MTDGVEIGNEKIALTINAMVRYQERSGETIFAALSALDSGEFDPLRLRRLIWAMLVKRPDDEDAAGSIIDGVGIKTASQALAEAVKLAFPDEATPPKK